MASFAEVKIARCGRFDAIIPAVSPHVPVSRITTKRQEGAGQWVRLQHTGAMISTLSYPLQPRAAIRGTSVRACGMTPQTEGVRRGTF